MKTKTITTVLLLGFVATSVAFAFRKLGSDSPSGQQSIASDAAGVNATPIGLDAKLAESQYSAVYFHSPHRCPTCRKIESFTQDALTAEIEAGNLAWQTADYTSDANRSLVDQFQVFTSTVVLVEFQAGKLVNWKNLEEVWNHTADQADFTAFIDQAWSEFKTL